MKLIVRDDDLSYFATPEQLNSLYFEVWNKKVVHFATVPKIYIHQNETPNKDYEKDYYWIGNNKKLVKFLKKKIKEGKVKIWQHGFTHENINGNYELEQKNKNKLYKELKKGKEHLEKTFNIKINTLVAPHDRFSKQALQAAEKIGYKYICRGFSPLPREVQLRPKYLLSYLKLFFFWIFRGRQYRYPKILDFGKHKEIFSYRIQHINKDNLKTILKLHNNKVLCITNHYRSLNKKKIKKLKKIMRKIKDENRSNHPEK